MNQAWMLKRCGRMIGVPVRRTRGWVLLLAAALPLGCNLDDWNWSRSQESGSSPVVSTPQATAPATPAPPAAGAPAAGEAQPGPDPLDDKVAAYVARLEAAGSSAAAPGVPPPPGVSRTAPQPEAGWYNNRNSAANGPGSDPSVRVGTPAPAQSPADSAQMAGAGSPANAQAFASPAPPPPAPGVELLEVRPAPANTATSHRLAAAQPNQPAAGGTVTPAPTLAAVIADLESRSHNGPRPLDEELNLRLLYLAAGMEDKAAARTGGDPARAELMTALIKTVAAGRRTLAQPGSMSPDAMTAVEDLRRVLSQRSGVMIPKVALVTRVNSFGDYDAVSPPRFAGGRPISMFCYTEVANFRSEPASDGRLRTLLSMKVEAFDSQGNVIWQQSEAGIEDLTRSPRRDFFIPFPVTLPAGTPAGDYVLKVTVEDKLGATMDQQRISFNIGR